jgi:hypothetical protein
MTQDEAESEVYEILALANNPASFFYLEEFPGMDKMGLNTGNVQDCLVGECVGEIIRARKEAEFLQADQMRTFPAGCVATKLRFGIIFPDQIRVAIRNAKA